MREDRPKCFHVGTLGVSAGMANENPRRAVGPPGGSAHRVWLSRISDAPNKEACPAGAVLNGEEEWPVNPDLGRLWLFLEVGCRSHHDNCSCGGCFGSLLIDLNEGFVKDVGDVEIIIRSPRRDPVEIGASLRDVKGALHTECFEGFPQCEERRLEPPFWQIENNFLRLETGTLR